MQPILFRVEGRLKTHDIDYTVLNKHRLIQTDDVLNKNNLTTESSVEAFVPCRQTFVRLKKRQIGIIYIFGVS